MLQRVQTLYLLAVVGVLVAFIFSPIAIFFNASAGLYTFDVFGVSNEQGEVMRSSYPLLILFVAIALLAFISIFLYKKRVMQMRILIYNIILLFLSSGLIYFYFYQFSNGFDVTDYTLKVGVVLPLIAIILTFMAYRNIRKDELLIRSMDRIR
jgi:hypothetical protein